MRGNNLITSKNYEYLRPQNCKEGRFYMLPKIHKKGAQGRPICSTMGHQTNKICQFVDAYLKKYVPHTKYYIKDMTDFIQKINSIGTLPHRSYWPLWMSLAYIPIYPHTEDWWPLLFI
jgi:hypothetical protein